MASLRFDDGVVGFMRSRRCSMLLAAVATVIASSFDGLPLGGSGSALAQDPPTLNGSWSATGLSEKWTVTDWGEACGPKPAAGGAPGGSVQVREQGGELSIVGAGRAFTTAECWEQMPGLARASHSASKRFWRTTCASAPNDPRRARVVTSISATDSSIVLSESGTYQFNIKDTACNAQVVRSRSFSLQHREGEAPPAASASATPTATAVAAPPPAPPPPPKPEPKPGKCTGNGGDPARLEVTPSRKLMRAGDKFSFRVAVFDVDGCAVGAKPSWTIAAGPLASKATIDAKGELSVPSDAEGKLEVVASIGDKGLTIPVEVASAANFDALLATSGLNSAGEADQAAVAVIATGTIGGKTSTADDTAKQRKTTFVVIVGSLALALGFVGLALSRRGKRAQAEAQREAERAQQEEDLTPPPAEDEGASPSRAPGPTGPADARAAGPPSVVKPKKPRGKICPTCGERFEAEATFCGKDGTVLVPLN